MSEHHHCHSEVNEENSGKTLKVVIITVITMALEIFYGYKTKSMALLSDGWHMGTHAFALTIALIAYIAADRISKSEKYSEKTAKKIPVLAGFVSSLFLGLTGVFVIKEAVMRFFYPENIEFNSAILVAVIGLFVNGFCLIIMQSEHSDEDYNYQAAYLHILTDALTSVFAIIALFAVKFFNWYYLDTLMGILGGYLIIRWSLKLIKDTTLVLLDIKEDTCK